MEIEAKFSIPDQETFDRLVQVERLAGFLLSPARLTQIHDQYLDTAAGAFLRGGWTCRVRLAGAGGRLLTLKSLASAQGLLHMRQELEVALPPQAGLDVAAWPESDATTLARQLSQGQPLHVLFDLQQDRYRRLAAAAPGSAAAVELSLDRVHFGAAAPQVSLAAEAELLPAGDLAGLRALASELHEGWGLSFETTSKFEQGLAHVRPDLLPLDFPR